MRNRRLLAGLALAFGAALVGGLAVWGGPVHVSATGVRIGTSAREMARDAGLRHVIEVNVDADEVEAVEQEVDGLHDQPDATPTTTGIVSTETPEATETPDATEPPEAIERPEATEPPEVDEDDAAQGVEDNDDQAQVSATPSPEEGDHGGGGDQGGDGGGDG